MSNFIKIVTLSSFCISAVYANVDFAIMKKHFTREDWLLFHSDLSFEQFKERKDILKSLNICDMDIEMHPDVPGEFYIALYKKDEKKARDVLISYLEKRRVWINNLKPEDVNAAAIARVRGIVQGTKMAAVFATASALCATFFPDSIKKADVAKAAMIFLIAGYFSQDNPFSRRSSLEFKKQCAQMSLISHYEYMDSLLEELVEQLAKDQNVATDKKPISPRSVRRSGG